MGSACYAVRVSRWLLALTLLMLPACESGAGQPDGALGAEQGTDGATSHPDHGTPVDGGGDGGGSDGGSTDGGGTDGSSTLDMGNPVGVPCSVQGVAGTCQLVSTCALMSTAGFCPGPADVRCCHPRHRRGRGHGPGHGQRPGHGRHLRPRRHAHPERWPQRGPGRGWLPRGHAAGGHHASAWTPTRRSCASTVAVAPCPKTGRPSTTRPRSQEDRP
jgi:hypothetical protein